MRTARRLSLVFVLYLAADFVDASAPGVFFFDSALFLGTVVQSKMRSADAADHAYRAPTALSRELSSVAEDRRSVPEVVRRSVVVTTFVPAARDATFTSDPPAPGEDH